MYVTINGTDYDAIKEISFAPEVDLSGDTLPINEFQVSIHTTDDIEIGQYAQLKDDTNTLWAKYWITYAEHEDAQTVKVRAKSPIYLLSQKRLPAELWSGKSAATAIQELMDGMSYTLDSSFSSATLDGFVPSQESRARLQWICYAIGAYVKTFFNDRIEIVPIDNTMTLIPPSKTFWKPSITYKDYVTALKAKAYTFTAGTPAVTDQWVEDSNGNYYIISETTITLTNDNVPASVPEHTISIEGLYLVNQTNVSAILLYLSDMYFKRMETDASVINNAEYMPGDKVYIYADEKTIMGGFIQRVEFSFGLQARGSMHLIPTDATTAAALMLTYMWGDIMLGEAAYYFPVGYTYSVTNPVKDATFDDHRYIFRPENAATTGTMTSEGATHTEQYHVALDFHEAVLTIIEVDSLTSENGVVTIG